MTEPRTVTWECLLGPVTPLTVLAELHQRGVSVSQWTAEVWHSQAVHDAAQLAGVAYDDFAALVERELLFVTHG